VPAGGVATGDPVSDPGTEERSLDWAECGGQKS
jgi:hypothetical protein